MIDFDRLLGLLVEAEVDFVVVGGVAAVLQGVPTTTFDLDIVPARNAENRRKLIEVLRELDAVYREHLPKRLEPLEDDLAGAGHLLLSTRLGPMDVLCTVVGARDFEQLVEHSDRVPVGDSRTVRVLDLEMLIRLKAEVGREKDLSQLPLLQSTLEQRRRR